MELIYLNRYLYPLQPLRNVLIPIEIQRILIGFRYYITVFVPQFERREVKGPVYPTIWLLTGLQYTNNLEKPPLISAI